MNLKKAYNYFQYSNEHKEMEKNKKDRKKTAPEQQQSQPEQ